MENSYTVSDFCGNRNGQFSSTQNRRFKTEYYNISMKIKLNIELS